MERGARSEDEKDAIIRYIKDFLSKIPAFGVPNGDGGCMEVVVVTHSGMLRDL